MASSRSSPSDLTFRLPPGERVCVGFSGGVDSVVLLDAMVGEGARPVTAVHVHHGLSPNADRWADFCRDFCAARAVPLSVERVTVDRAAPEGLEAAARTQRYAIYAARPEPYVALAHHLDDQAETVFLQLMRGAGLKGVAAMPELRPLPSSHVRLYRPLLSIARAEIVARAKSRGLAWIEDESNDSTRHDRNFLRHEVAPLLDARFPGWRESLARFSRHAASAEAILEELAQDDGPDAEGSLTWDGEHAPLYLHGSLTEARRANALRAYLHRHGLPMPSEARLEEMARQLYDARDDAAVRIDHADAVIVRRRNRAYLETRPFGGDLWRVDWHGEREVNLGGSRGCVCFAEREGEGIDPARTSAGAWHFGPRMGGEKIRLAPGAPRRTLKKVLQERGFTIPQRQMRPCLFHDGRLVWMPGIGIEAEYRVSGAAQGLFPLWTMA